jgi:aspartate/methionine/tyrosine aminotransferase
VGLSGDIRRQDPPRCVTTFSALPESLGIETRFYRVRRDNNFHIDLDEIERLADSRTKLILVNSPHNPTGATMSDAEMEALHEFASQRGIQLVSDEVYHPQVATRTLFTRPRSSGPPPNSQRAWFQPLTRHIPRVADGPDPPRHA